MASRGIFSPITDIRRKVFTEVARLAYDGDYDRVEELPYKIIPGTRSSYRNSIFLERAIVGERIRLAIGLPLRPLEQHAPIAQGIKESAIAEKYYDPPLVNVIKFACNACPEKSVRVTGMCQGCLELPCREGCPLRLLRPVPGQLPVRRDCGQGPDFPGRPRAQAGRRGVRGRGAGVCRPVRPEGHARKAARGV